MGVNSAEESLDTTAFVASWMVDNMMVAITSFLVRAALIYGVLFFSEEGGVNDPR